jgi:hypothetical protein
LNRELGSESGETRECRACASTYERAQTGRPGASTFGNDALSNE